MTFQQRRNGKLITIEGVDGAGKTTLANSVAETLYQRSIDVCQFREPGGSELSERLREILSNPQLQICDRSETLLFMAARAQLVEQHISPALQAGKWVILDRFIDSSLVYQGIARGLGLDKISFLNNFATGGLEPDQTLLLTLPTDIAAARRQERDEQIDRLEAEKQDFFEKVIGGYKLLARRAPKRIHKINANQPFEGVYRDALAALQIEPIR